MANKFDDEMDMAPQLNRVTQEPDVMGGKACIRGMRVTVGMVVGQIGAGHSADELLAETIPAWNAKTSCGRFARPRGPRGHAVLQLQSA